MTKAVPADLVASRVQFAQMRPTEVPLFADTVAVDKERRVHRAPGEERDRQHLTAVTVVEFECHQSPRERGHAV